MTRPATRALRLGGSIVLLAVVILLLPRGELQRALTQASPVMILGAVGVFLLGHVAAAFKWRLLMGPATDLTFGRALRAHFAGLVGTLTPLGMIGGDVVRAGAAMTGSQRSSAIVLTTVIDRVVDTCALLALSFTGLLWVGSRSEGLAVVLWGGAILALTGVAALAVGRRLLQRSQHPRLASIREAFAVLEQHPLLIACALLLSLAIQGLFVITNAYLGASVGVQVAFAAWLFAWPAAKFAAYLPIGIAGIGIRETALVALLAPFGGASGPVLAAGLLWDAVLIVGSVGGWLLLRLSPSVPAPVVSQVPHR